MSLPALLRRRINWTKNPRGDGAVVGTIGSGGAVPTGWNLVNVSGLSASVAASGVENGVPYAEIRIFGTTTAAGVVFIWTGAQTDVPAAPGQTWAPSAYIRLSAGSVTGVTSFQYLGQWQNSVPSGIGISGTNTFTPTGAGLETQRIANNIGAAPATTAYVLPQFRATVPITTAIDFTLRIGAPMTEQATSPYPSLILPPPGSPGVSGVWV